MVTLKQFALKISSFNDLRSGDQIRYFVYYLLIEKKNRMVRAQQVLDCFHELHLNPYSNISQYLFTHSKKGRYQYFIRRNDGYLLLAKTKNLIDEELNKPPVINPTDSLFPLSIFENTRGYLKEFAKEACCTYDWGLYNSCLFLIRKITETLIIEIYESKNLQSSIKTSDGDYFHLSGLIKSVTSEKSWKLSKIVQGNLPQIKLLADSSVHSKRFSTKKSDIDNIKDNVRITFEELITMVDYPNWRN